MAETKIQWTATRGPDGTLQPGFTFNHVLGCHKVSPACKHCYAETLTSNRMGLKVWGQGAPRKVTSPAYWQQPIRWNKQAQQLGVRLKVFCASLADVFEDHAGPLTRNNGDTRAWHTLHDVRRALWQLIEDTPNLDWLLLTKRPENVRRFAPSLWLPGIATGQGGQWPANVWIGTTCEDQEHAAQRLPHLLNIPAAVRFVSYEPALGPVDFRPWLRPRLPGDPPQWKRSVQTPEGPRDGIDWIIVGSESGPKARPAEVDWYRQTRDACAGAGVTFFYKQHTIDGKTEGLPLLDGKQHMEWPRP